MALTLDSVDLIDLLITCDTREPFLLSLDILIIPNYVFLMYMYR